MQIKTQLQKSYIQKYTYDVKLLREWLIAHTAMQDTHNKKYGRAYMHNVH